MKYMQKPSNLRDIKHIQKSKNRVDNELIVLISGRMYIYDLITSCHGHMHIRSSSLVGTDAQASKDTPQTNISIIVQHGQSNQGHPANT